MRIGIDLYGFDPDNFGGVSTFVLGLTNGLLNNVTKTDIVTIFISEKNENQLRSSFDKKSVTFIKICFEGLKSAAKVKQANEISE